MAKQTTIQEFESVFPKLEEVLLEHAKKYNLPEKELAWYKQVCRCLTHFMGHAILTSV